MLELDDVAVQSLVPEPLQTVESPAAFMKALPKYDSDMDALLQAAEAEDECLRFVGEQRCRQAQPHCCTMCVNQRHMTQPCKMTCEQSMQLLLQSALLGAATVQSLFCRQCYCPSMCPCMGTACRPWDTAVVRGQQQTCLALAAWHARLSALLTWSQAAAVAILLSDALSGHFLHPALCRRGGCGQPQRQRGVETIPQEPPFCAAEWQRQHHRLHHPEICRPAPHSQVSCVYGPWSTSRHA